MPSHALTLAMLLAVPAAHAATESQELVATVNAVRARGCSGRPAAEPALGADARLDRVAARVAAGDSLQDALRSAGYRAMQVAVLEATGNPDSIGRSLAAGGCKDVTDAVYRDLGVAQRSGATWLVLSGAPRGAGCG